MIMKNIKFFLAFLAIFIAGIGALYAMGYYTGLNHQDWNPTYFSLGLIPIVIAATAFTAISVKKIQQPNAEENGNASKQSSYFIMAKRLIVISLFAFVVYSYGYLIGSIGYERNLVDYLFGGLLTIVLFSPGYQIYYIYYRKK